ncbi:hypothetical protein B296_00057545 [Ensete ventricosum]|uniref:Uncharacterized protein n=1 Tax=Ensete ventricosum TaxID=4639 RepID=A0A426WYQ8_ENSVE|nr:hypothetical protein B296_00057545 [Ensete ventricosum]
MSQDRHSSLFPNRTIEEAVPLTPTIVTVPQVTIAPLAPHLGLTNARQSTLTPDRYWRLLTDPRLTPHLVHTAPQMVTTEGLLQADPSSTSLDRDDTGYHPPHSSARPNHGSPSAGAPATHGRPRGLSRTRDANPTWTRRAGPTGITRATHNNLMRESTCIQPTKVEISTCWASAVYQHVLSMHPSATISPVVPELRPSTTISPIVLELHPSGTISSIVPE